MVATAELPTEEFNKLPVALRAIAFAAGAAARDVLRGEAGIILKSWAAATPAASAPKTDKRSNLRFLRGLELTGKNPGVPVTVSAGIRKGSAFGRVHLRTSTGHWRRTHDAGFKPVAGMPGTNRKKPGDHYSDFDWLVIRSAIAEVKGGIAAARAAGRRTIGLARQSVIQIADTLGIRLENVRGGSFYGKTISPAAIAKARGAVAYNGQRYANGLGTEQRTSYDLILTLLNRYPAGRKIGMDALLAGVLRGRIRYFEKNMELGVFDNVWKTAKAYPYLQVLSNG
jgi:hypothetical protein